jgi:Ca-activated chloride channel family protein
MKTSLITEAHPTPGPGGTLVRALLRIEGEVPEDERRVPLNLSLVLDRSGSMSGGKLEAVKEAARGLIRRLHPQDVVSVVAFDDRVDTVAHPGTAGDQGGLEAALMAMQPGATTNLSGGWLQGRALLQEHFDAEGVNRVILLTDGLANVGVTDRETLTRLAAQARESGAGTTTVGVGADFDEELLVAMADAGGGSHYYIERLDQAGGVFEEEIEGLLGIAAQNLTVTIRPREAVAVAAVHHGYPSHPLADGSLRLEVGDLYAREPREVLADFLVPGEMVPERPAPEGGAKPEAGNDSPVADLVVEGDVWAPDGSVDRRRVTLALTWSPEAGAVTHPEVERVFLLLQAARARQEAVERGDRGDLGGAARSLRDTAARLEEASDEDDLTVREEVEDLYRVAASLEAEADFQSEDRKYLRSSSVHYSRSRRSAGDRNRRE